MEVSTNRGVQSSHAYLISCCCNSLDHWNSQSLSFEHRFPG